MVIYIYLGIRQNVRVTTAHKNVNIFHSFYNYMYAQRFRFCTFLLLQSFNFVISLSVIIMWVIYGQVRLFSTRPTAKKTPASTCSRCLLFNAKYNSSTSRTTPLFHYFTISLVHYFATSLFHYFTTSLLHYSRSSASNNPPAPTPPRIPPTPEEYPLTVPLLEEQEPDPFSNRAPLYTSVQKKGNYSDVVANSTFSKHSAYSTLFLKTPCILLYTIPHKSLHYTLSYSEVFGRFSSFLLSLFCQWLN